MAKDKKAEGDAVRFVLLEGIGAVCTRVLSVSDVISILQ
jgi:3-dehydroquinate synthetase